MQKSDYIRIRLTETQKEQIKEIADSEGISMSQYVLDLIRADMKERKSDSKGRK